MFRFGENSLLGSVPLLLIQFGTSSFTGWVCLGVTWVREGGFGASESLSPEHLLLCVLRCILSNPDTLMSLIMILFLGGAWVGFGVSPSFFYKNFSHLLVFPSIAASLPGYITTLPPSPPPPRSLFQVTPALENPWLPRLTLPIHTFLTHFFWPLQGPGLWSCRPCSQGSLSGGASLAAPWGCGKWVFISYSLFHEARVFHLRPAPGPAWGASSLCVL